MKSKVSVVMITYGQEKYIEEAIRGVFIQKTDFPIELIIANDKSPDSTDEIVKKIIKSAPKNIKVKYIQHSENKGMVSNLVFALKMAEGKYIATCEGDDYWLDENKLQKQVEFLESNEDFVITFHNVFFRNGDDLKADIEYEKKLENKDIYALEDLSIGNIMHTPSVVFRNIKINFPDWYYTSFLGDYPLWLWLSKYGKIKYFPEKMAVYRMNVGVWSMKSQEEREFKTACVLKELICDFKEFPVAKRHLLFQKNRCIKAYLKNRKFIEIFTSPLFKDLRFMDKIRCLKNKIFNNY